MASQSKRRNTLNTPAARGRSVGASPPGVALCPYTYEIIDGRLIIEGEDFGEAEKALQDGKKMIELVRIMADVQSQES